MGFKHHLDDSRALENANKKHKSSEANGLVVSHADAITTSRDIRQLLAFTQTADSRKRNDIDHVRRYLADALDPDTLRVKDEPLVALRDFLVSSIDNNAISPGSALSDLFQTWDLAASVGNDGLQSTICALLAQLLKTISPELALREQGLVVGQVLSSERYIKFILPAISASGTRTHATCAALDLLREIVSFDGGALSKTVLRHRASIFPRFHELLSLRDSKAESRRSQSSLRSRHHSLTFFLAFLRYQEASSKVETLTDYKLFHALFQFIHEDPPADVLLILRTLDVSVLSNRQIAHSVKSRLLSEAVLSRILKLFQYTHASEADSNLVKNAAHDFLTTICSTPDKGVLVESHGWYMPHEVAAKDIPETHSDTPNKLAASSWDTYHDRVPVRNSKLSFFVQRLRPYKNLKHRELLLKIFQAAPELVADYFLRRKLFSFEPKLTSTWVGLAGLIIQVAWLEPPTFSTQRGPPNPSIVVENILPSCTSGRIFNRCMCHSPSLVALLAAKLMVAALQKFKKLLQASEKIPAIFNVPVWQESVSLLLKDRLPDLSEVTTALRACSESQPQLKEALLQLIALYYDVLPSACLGVKYDISLPLAKRLSGVGTASFDKLRLLDIAHLSHIAFTSPTDFDWFRKPDQLPLSPFTAILRLRLISGDLSLDKILESVTYDHFIVQRVTTAKVWPILIRCLEQDVQFDALFSFLDNCFVRLTQKLTKYEGDAVLLSKKHFPVASLLTVTFQEQWPYFIKSHRKEEATRLLSWLLRWLQECSKAGEDIEVLALVRKDVLRQINDAVACEVANMHSFEQDDTAEIQYKPTENIDDDSPARLHKHEDEAKIANISGEIESESQMTQPTDRSSQLFRWSRKDVVDAVEDGDVSQLILCLSASEYNIRAEALTQLRRLSAKVQVSDFSEKEQLYLLLMELVETAVQEGLQRSLPSVVGALAAYCVPVLNKPTHRMYSKLNRFLLRGPEWDVSHLVSYWKDKVFAKASVEESNYAEEAEWLCDILFEGLRTPEDFDLYRRQQLWETLLLRYKSISTKFATKLIRLLWRCTLIEGCSTILITRCGILSWCRENGGDLSIAALMEKLLASCDRSRVSDWAGLVDDDADLISMFARDFSLPLLVN